MKAIQAILSVSTIPFMLLNCFGGIVSGIWLAVLGQWWAIGFGIASLFLSSYLLGRALMPGFIFFATPGLMLAQKGKLILAFPLMLLSMLYTYLVVIAWCIFVFIYFMSYSNSTLFWPLLIWSYGVALTPLMYMVQREQMAGNTEDRSWMMTFFAQLAYVAIAFIAVFTHTALIDLVIIFGGLMLIGLLVQTGLGVASIVEQKRLGAI